MKTDWASFKKLFKVPIPVDKHAEYYIETLARSQEWAHLPGLLEEFKAFQARCPEGQVGAVRKATMNQLIDYLTSTEAYKAFQAGEHYEPISTCDKRGQFDEWSVVSIDLVAANFYTFWSFGLPHDTWEDLCESQGVDPLLIKSKSFRQIVFGNLNPKRNQRVQAANMDKIHKSLQETLGDKFHLVFLQHDELIFVSDGDVDDSVRASKEAISQLGEIPARINVHSKQRLGGKGQFVVQHFDPDTFHMLYKTLFGVPGTRYFIEFKKHILKEPLDERDRLFVNDGKIAMWLE